MHSAEMSTPDKLAKALEGVHEDFKAKLAKNNTALIPVAGTKDMPMLFRPAAAPMVKGMLFDDAELAYTLMKTCLEHRLPQNYDPMSKASISMSSNIYGYDLRAPSVHLIPFLSPIRDETPRMTPKEPGNAHNWKVINANQLTTAGFVGAPYLNEGQRAPLVSISATPQSASYCTIGVDGSDTFEAQSSGRGFEDPLATARFLSLESLMVWEENALLGGDKTLKLGAANTPAVTTPSGTGSITGTYYCYVVALTYEGYQNQSGTTLVPQKSLTTPDGKTMQVNGGIGAISAASSASSPSSNASYGFSVTPKLGEYAYAWFVGTSAATSAAYLQAITTAPAITLTAAPTTTGQLANAWTSSTDYSVNDGTTGGGANQVTGMDGFLTQALNAYYNGGGTQNAYYLNLGTATAGGSVLHTSGRGSVTEIDTALQTMWSGVSPANPWRVTADAIWVNAQELKSITNLCLANGSAPLVRYDLDADGEHYDMTASGTIGFYFNPYIPGGGRKIPIYVHPTIPPGTIFLQGKRLPPYFKKSNMTNVAEVVTKRDYYSVDWAQTTREYQFGTYAEEVLAVYAPFALGVIQGCLPS